MRDLIFEPVFPGQLVLGLAALLALAAALVYARQRATAGPVRAAVLAVLRAAAVAAIAVILLRPMRLQPAPSGGPRPRFTVLVDTSASMNTADVGGRPRIEAVLAALQGGDAPFLRELASGCDLAVYEFSDSARPASLAALKPDTCAAGNRTDLARALPMPAAAWPDRRHAGLLVLSDGHDNADGNAAEAALLLKARQIPVWTVCVGTDAGARDIGVSAALSQNFLFARQPGTLRAVLSQSGYDQWHVNVNVYREDRLLVTRQVILRRAVQTVEFPVTEESKGLYRYRVTVDPVAGESDPANNSRTVFARVVDEQTRILLVEAKPHWDSKFVRRALGNDPNLNVSSVFYVSPTRVFAIEERTSGKDLGKERRETSLRFPHSREELFAYDCLLLGRDVDTLLTPDDTRLLRDYVSQRGGSIVFFRGRPYGEHPPAGLADLEPVAWSDEVLHELRMELTPEGRVSPVFAFHGAEPPDVIVRSMPPLVSATRIEKGKSLAVILAVAGQGDSAEKLATVAYHRYGRGKVMTVSGFGLWRWALLPRELDGYEDVYGRFWRQMVQWLVFETDFLPGQDVTFRTDSYTYQPGDRVRFSVATRHLDPAAYRPAVEVRPPAGAAATLRPVAAEDRPETFTAAFSPDAEGEYEAVLSGNLGQPARDTIRFTVYADSVERRLVGANPDLLAQVASVTGGETLALRDLERLPAKVSAFARRSALKPKAEDAWDRRAVFWALALTLAAEWFLRRRWGMV